MYVLFVYNFLLVMVPPYEQIPSSWEFVNITPYIWFLNADVIWGNNIYEQPTKG